LGGYVQSEENLSHDGNCWMFDRAQVFDEAQASGNEKVSGNQQQTDNIIAAPHQASKQRLAPAPDTDPFADYQTRIVQPSYRVVSRGAEEEKPGRGR
jgi:hypothetical protein